MVQSPTLIQALKLLLMLSVAVFLFLLRKNKSGGAIQRNMLSKDPV